MNTPNKLTVLRMILVPFFVASLLAGDSLPHHNLIALVIFAAASYTDHLDGKIARSRNLVTTFGKFMDPLADKIMVISALVCFVSQGLADVWLVLLIIFREFMVTSVRLVAADSRVVVAANNWGKAKTVSQIIAILFVLFFHMSRFKGARLGSGTRPRREGPLSDKHRFVGQRYTLLPSGDGKCVETTQGTTDGSNPSARGASRAAILQRFSLDNKSFDRPGTASMRHTSKASEGILSSLREMNDSPPAIMR